MKTIKLILLYIKVLLLSFPINIFKILKLFVYYLKIKLINKL